MSCSSELVSTENFAMVDRISTLPDSVLCHILYFLPTEIAVATSVLSKRWRHLWRSVPALDFSNRDVMRRISWLLDSAPDLRDRQMILLDACSRFTDFVYSILLSRDAAQPIPAFFLDIDNFFDFYDFSSAVNNWVNVVSQRRVEHAHLKMDAPSNLPKLPISILNCTTLVVLKLKSFSVKGFSSVRLPSLKTLHLEDMKFLKDRYLMMLLAGCPILEDFLVLYAEFDFQESLTNREFESLSLTKMKNAYIEDIMGFDFHFPLKALYNVETLRIDIDNQVYRTNDIPTFHNLIDLELIFDKYKWHLVVEVLNHCPKLQDLLLYEEVKVERADDEDNWVDPEFVPECLSFQLRTCKLSKFVGLQGEFLFARYILKNARVLQTMEICGKGQLKKIKRKLSSCPMSSAKCKLLVK